MNVTEGSSPEPIDQLAHNDGPPLDDAVEHGDPPVIKVEGTMRSGRNG